MSWWFLTIRFVFDLLHFGHGIRLRGHLIYRSMFEPSTSYVNFRAGEGRWAKAGDLNWLIFFVQMLQGICRWSKVSQIVFENLLVSALKWLTSPS